MLPSGGLVPLLSRSVLVACRMRCYNWYATQHEKRHFSEEITRGLGSRVGAVKALLQGAGGKVRRSGLNQDIIFVMHVLKTSIIPFLLSVYRKRKTAEL